MCVRCFSGSIRFLCIAFAALCVAACSTNPVTGKRELSLYSTATQIKMGEQNYAPSQQSQGGKYYLDEDLNAYISAVGQKLVVASRAAIPNAADLPYEFVVLNNNVPNAWALPGGKIAINRGLLTELQDESELAAVLGHEIIHAAAEHGAARLTKNTIFGIGSLAVNVAAKDSEYGKLINQGTQIGAAAWMAKYGRDDELESDRYGMQIMVEAGYDPYGAVRLQETFVRLSGNKKADFISGLFASHPPSHERVTANRAFADTLPKGGVSNRAAYQRAISQLKSDAAAYEAEQKAISHLNDKKPAQALRQLDKAVKIQNSEGSFWELRGHAWKMKNNLSNADKAFSTAISKNPNFFRHWLARGILRKEQGEFDKANRDLSKSQQLLPNATAAYLQGEIAEVKGDQQLAMQFFQQASSAGGELGASARIKVVSYDLPGNPAKYVASGLRKAENGALYVVVHNRSGISVEGITVRLTTVNGLQKTMSFDGVLKHNTQQVLATGITGEPANFKVSVIAGRPAQVQPG